MQPPSYDIQVSWESFAKALRARGAVSELLSCLSFMPTALAIGELEWLKGQDHSSLSPAARRLLKAPCEPDDFLYWARPPWDRLAESEMVEPLLDGLNRHYLQVSRVLDGRPELMPRLLPLLREDRYPALHQWFEERKPVFGKDIEGWQEASLLTGAPLDPDDLVPFLTHPRFQEPAREQFVKRSYQQALLALLSAGSTDFELLPEPSAERDRALHSMLTRKTAPRELMRRACADEAAAIEVLWKQNPYPALEDWHRELTGQPPTGQTAGTASDERWRAAIHLPLCEASEEVRRLDTEGFVPRHRPDLFDRARALTEAGPLLAVLPRESVLHELPADRVWCDRGVVVGYHHQTQTFWSRSWSDETVQIKAAEILEQVNGAWWCDGCFLVLGTDLRLLGLDGGELWRRELERSGIYVAVRGSRIAVLSEQKLVVLELNSGRELASWSFPVQLNPVRRSRGWVVAAGPAQTVLKWSADGSYLTTSLAGSVYVWNAETLELMQLLEHESGVIDVWCGDGWVLTVAGGSMGGTAFMGAPVRAWDLSSGEALWRESFFGSSDVRGLSVDLFLNYHDTMPPSLHVCRIGEEGALLECSEVRPPGRYFSNSGQRVGGRSSVCGELILLEDGKTQWAVVERYRGEVLTRFESDHMFWHPEGGRLFRWSRGVLSKIELWDRRPVVKLDPRTASTTAAEFLRVMKELRLS
jgi:hypothetical protein